MRKSGRTCDEGEQTSRRWIRGPIASPRNGPAPTKPAKASAGAGGKPAKRFVEPYPYTDEQRAEIAAALATDGVGDDTAREIFIGAIAYDLALLQAAASEPAQAPSPVPAELQNKRPDQTHGGSGQGSESDEPPRSVSESSVAASSDTTSNSAPQARSPVASLSDMAQTLAELCDGGGLQAHAGTQARLEGQQFGGAKLVGKPQVASQDHEEQGLRIELLTRQQAQLAQDDGQRLLSFIHDQQWACAGQFQMCLPLLAHHLERAPAIAPTQRYTECVS